MEYEKILSKTLEKQPLVRHLWSRLGTEVMVETVSLKIRGILRSIDIAWKWIEVDSPSLGKTFFVNLRHVVAIRTVGTDKIVGK